MPRKPYNYHYIYKTTCLITNRFYVGMHSSHAEKDTYIGSGVVLRRSIRKYGKENHKFEILEVLSDRESLIKREEEIVNEDFLKNPLCMNLIKGGTAVHEKRQPSGWTYQMSELHKVNLTKALQNKNNKYPSEETRKKMSDSHKGLLKGVKFSEERKQQMREISLANGTGHSNKGKVHSFETRVNTSFVILKRFKPNLSDDALMQIATDNVRKKDELKNQPKQYKFSEESRKRMSEARKKSFLEGKSKSPGFGTLIKCE